MYTRLYNFTTSETRPIFTVIISINGYSSISLIASRAGLTIRATLKQYMHIKQLLNIKIYLNTKT